MTKKSVLEKCSNCGAKIRSRARYCHRCGKPLGLSQDNASEESAKLSKALKNNETTKLDTGEVEAELVEIAQSKSQNDSFSFVNVDEEKFLEKAEEKFLEEAEYAEQKLEKYKTKEELVKDSSSAKDEEIGNIRVEESFEAKISDEQDNSKVETEQAAILSFDKPVEKPEKPFDGLFAHDEDLGKPIEKTSTSFDLAHNDLTLEKPVDAVHVEAERGDVTGNEKQASRESAMREKRFSETRVTWIAPESEGNFLYLVATAIFSLISLLLLLMMLWLK